MALVFVDECGYTGQDLMNSDQPVLSIATVKAGECTCQTLKDRFFGRVRAAELKHSSLARRPQQPRMVLNFLEHLSTQPQLVKLGIAHKKYTLITKMVDLIVAPAALRCGTNLQEGGVNTLLSSTFFHQLPDIGGVEFFNRLMIAFCRMMLLRTRQSYDDFFQLVHRNTRSRRVNKILSFLRMGDIDHGMQLFHGSSHCLDVAVALTLGLTSKWREEIPAGQNITVIHDISSAMARDRYLWDLLVSERVPPTELSFGPDHQFPFSIGIRRTRPENSRNWVGLQLADIVAGAAARHARWSLEGESGDDDYGRRLAEIMPLFAPIHAIWPVQGMSPDAIDNLGRFDTGTQ
jgi:hypothetical protein